MWTVAVLVFGFVSMVIFGSVKCHGFLAEPPARNSMWRAGFGTRKNFDDNGLNCGGYRHQWIFNGGKCGLCGDPYDSPQLHEAGGLYANVNRPISRCYNKDTTTIDIVTKITVYHKGYFEFRLCPNNDMSTDPGEDCSKNGRLLEVTGTRGQTRYDINLGKQDYYNFTLDIPEDIQCSQCILHWKYNTGNSWGCDPLQEGQMTPTCGIGYGPQEQFINCADIAILDDCSFTTTVDPNATVATPSVTPWTGTPRTPAPTTDSSGGGGGGGGVQCIVKAPMKSEIVCEAVGDFANVEGMAAWCQENCYDSTLPLCPPHQCSCPGI